MFFQEHEKQIYVAPNGGKFDPLAVERALVVHSGGKLNEILKAWSAGSDGQGDVGDGAKEQNRILSAQAEEMLAGIARKVFQVPDFPDGLDAQALECLCHYWEWMEGKGKPGMARQS